MNTPKFHPLLRLSQALCAVVFALVSGCGKPPTIPQLPGHTAQLADRVLLDDQIDASDIRQIFSAMNQDGKLESLKPWIEKTSDEELHTIGRLITRYFYQSAHDPEGAVSLLKERTMSRSFTRALNLSREWSRAGQARYLTQLAETAMRSPHWLEVVERDIGFMSPDLDESLNDLHSELEKAWGCDGQCPKLDPVPAKQVVADVSRFLSTSGLKGSWVELCGSLSDSWPIVGFLHGLREVNQRHGGRAFDGMGSGLSKMIREPKDPAKGNLPTQFDSLMDLMLALNGPSDGLFALVHKKLSEDKDLVRELGSILQPNLPGRMLGYAPIIPDTHFGLLLSNLKNTDGSGFEKSDWLALNSESGSDEATQAFLKFFSSSRTAHETITGSPRDPGTNDYLVFNLPLYLNNFVLTEWAREVVKQNKVLFEALPKDAFVEQVWSAPIRVKAFQSHFTSSISGADPVFLADRLKVLSDFGLSEFVDSLSKSPPLGLGGFEYNIPELKDVPLKDAMRTAIEAIDQTRGFADGSALLRSVIAFLIRPNGPGGKSFLENLETQDLLLSAHRMLASMPSESWKTIRSVLFDGIGIEALPPETRKILLGFYESKPELANRFSRILDSVAMLKKLDSAPGEGVSAFEAYHEIVRETGPREWRALSEAWVFVAQSGLFALDGNEKGVAPRFPSAYSRLSEGDASGLLRLAAGVQPSRHRPLADFFNEALREKYGRRGSEVHWEFVQDVVKGSPDGVAGLWDSYRSGTWNESRTTFSPKERAWMVRFVREGALRDLWQVFGDRLLASGSPAWARELQRLSDSGSLKNAFRLLSLVKNDRIREIAYALQDWDSSGELDAFLESVNTLSAP